jgi:hypothetical protein
MANLNPTPGWDAVPQLEETTLAKGGPGGPMNTQAQALLNRTEKLAADDALTLSAAKEYTDEAVSAATPADGSVTDAKVSQDAGIAASKLAIDLAAAYKQMSVGWAIQQAATAVNVLRYIPPEQWPAIMEGASTYDATAAIQSAVDANAVLDGAGGTYLVTSVHVDSKRRLQNFNFVSAGGSTDLVSVIDVDGTTVAKSDIAFVNVTIDGKRASHTNITTPTENGGRHGFRIRGTVSKLRILHCKANNCATDGLEIFSAGVAWPAFRDIAVEHCEFNGNRRHGFSLDSCVGVRFVNVTANGNGLDLNTTDPQTSGARGDRIGTSLYGNGCDVESYGTGTHVEDLTFDYCTMLGNARSGLLILPNGSGYGNPAWKPYSSVTIRGGYYDAGVDASSEGYSIMFTALGLTDSQTGVVGVTLDGPRCDKGFLLKYAQQVDGAIRVDNTNSGYHATIVDAFDVGLDVMCSGPPAIYQSNCTLAVKQRFTGTATPGLAVLTGPASISSQTTTLLTSSKEAGAVYAIEAQVNITGSDATQTGYLQITGGRTIVNVSASAVDGNDGSVRPLYFRRFASTIFFKPGSLATHNVTIFVTVL